ncbi:hypothetical protein [Sulfuriferula sp.]|uniref:hypothetical protein n=1 Tax=Sulfuriferula sp. TaxID=2025307 RepID=UPI002730BCD6|nr:hypothetical protein [Sulfuriferula sp.]MDP2026286.1 hypothetical protein [Sulfuriferula sp.]
MDLLKLIKTKAKLFDGTSSERGVDAIIHHIEISESHYELGKSNGEHLYTDVIYRTNQAFEGALKEAFRVLTGSDPSKKSPHEIEKHFESNKLLKERVLAQFATYRTDWRNKSTHDYQLFFSSQEALLAIVSVSAFFNILLDQITEKRSFDLEKEKVLRRAKGFFGDGNVYGSMGFMQQIIELLKLFSDELREEGAIDISVKEYELLGRLAGFISAADPDIVISTEQAINYGSRRLMMDMLLKKGDGSVILELKRPSVEFTRRAREGMEQLKHYLVASNISQGIVYAPALTKQVEKDYRESFIDVPTGELKIATLTPAMLIE